MTRSWTIVICERSEAIQLQGETEFWIASSLALLAMTRDYEGLNFNHHAVFGGLVFKLAAAREHVITHMREDEPFRPDLVQMLFQQTQRHMGGDRLVARIGLADEQIGIAADLDQRIRPL